MKKSFVNIEYDKETDITDLSMKASKEDLESMIIFLLIIFYEESNKDKEKIKLLLKKFNECKKDTSNILSVSL